MMEEKELINLLITLTRLDVIENNIKFMTPDPDSWYEMVYEYLVKYKRKDLSKEEIDKLNGYTVTHLTYEEFKVETIEEEVILDRLLECHLQDLIPELSEKKYKYQNPTSFSIDSS